MAVIVVKGGLCVFTDGSWYEGGVGAATVAMKGEEERPKIGIGPPNPQSPVLVTGTILVLDLIKSTPRITSADIFMDCQPAIAALASPKTQPGQYLLTMFHTTLHRLLRAHTTLCLRIHWVPAHVGIVCNEAVDARVKEAALGASTPRIVYPSP
ncbi:hypothetical protein DFH09DRAFT_1323858 [Mycena vulgaris]|nr:hypothetical protein DFH09DRAFT_1323858 [Mycena vulgaris]